MGQRAEIGSYDSPTITSVIKRARDVARWRKLGGRGHTSESKRGRHPRTTSSRWSYEKEIQIGPA